MPEEMTIPRVACRIRMEDCERCTVSAINTADAAIQLTRPIMRDADREILCAVHLDAIGRPICWDVVAVGSAVSASFRTADFFKAAILSNASWVIAVHNHPSGDCRPSDIDRDITRKMKEAGELLGIGLIDHIIIPGGDTQEYFSFSEDGTL